MDLGLSEPLHTLVDNKYKSAKAASALTFSETQSTILHTRSGTPFQLRYCPSLGKKPVPKNDHYEKDHTLKNSDSAPNPTPKAKPDPFKDPPAELLVAEVRLPSGHHVSNEDDDDGTSGEPTHLIVLNKFPIIPHHFILATREDKPQTDRLEPEDLGVTYSCLRAWREGGDDEKEEEKEKARVGVKRSLFAFFNSGEHSGASQAHRHLQFVSVEDMVDGLDGEGSWTSLIDLILSKGKEVIAPGEAIRTTDSKEVNLLALDSLPFIHFATRLSPYSSKEGLHATYLSLYNTAVQAVDGSPSSKTSKGKQTTTISYNLAMTTEGMVILPRRSEGVAIPLSTSPSSEERNDQKTAAVNLNGTILAGTLMVKGQQEWDILREAEMAGHGNEILESILAGIGFPKLDERR